MMEIVEERLGRITASLFAEGKVPVTQGFIGMTQSGRRTTMGRESSDYSAAIIGSALKAADVQIWTDVDGILTADPRIVPSPKKVKQLSFKEAYELSYFGAKVLHPNTMIPALEKNIPIHIYNSRRPQSSGTLVFAGKPHEKTIIKSIAYKNDLVVLTVTPAKRFSPYIFWEHIYSILTKFNVVPAITVTSEYSMAIALDAKHDLPAIIHEIGEAGEVRLIGKQGIVSVVGENVRQAPAIIDRIFRPIADVPVTMVSFGASESNLSFIVDEAKTADVVRRIHSEFFDSMLDTEIFEVLDPIPAKT